jgi:hypothetical protein
MVFPQHDLLIARRASLPDATEVSRIQKHDPETACPALDAGWQPVFRKHHAQAKSRQRHIQRS